VLRSLADDTDFASQVAILMVGQMICH